MVDEEGDLTRDPVFQLNACLWMVRKTGIASSQGLAPALARHHYALRAIGFRLASPAAMKQSLVRMGLGYDPPEPDVVLKNVPIETHLVIECKASSFGPDSSTASQAVKLLAMCSDPNTSLGARGQAAVLYLLSEEQAQDQRHTLQVLQERLREFGLQSASHGTIGLKFTDSGLVAQIEITSISPESPFVTILGEHQIVEGNQAEARPLYIIPFDPTAIREQARSEQEYCSRQLAERLCTSAMGVLGRSHPPDVVRLDLTDLFAAATFDASKYWKARELQHLKAKLTRFLLQILNRGEIKGRVQQDHDCVEVSLANQEELEVAQNLLRQAPVDRLERLILDRQGEIFSGLDEQPTLAETEVPGLHGGPQAGDVPPMAQQDQEE